MQNAKTMGMAPRKIAEEITSRMDCGALVEKSQVTIEQVGIALDRGKHVGHGVGAHEGARSLFG